VQFPPMRHDWQHHNFGFWVMGSPAVDVVGLPLDPKHQYDRKYSIIQLWVLGFGSAAVETLLVYTLPITNRRHSGAGEAISLQDELFCAK
jgi:hypothetical protein